MKVVLDTNVLIEGLKDEFSYEKRILDEVIGGRVEAYANHQTLQENKLLARQLIQSPEYEQVLNDYFRQVNNVINRRQIHIVSDPEDNKILESAVEAQADYLISSDNSLLRLGHYQQVKIVNPAEFWVKYSDDDKDNLWTQWTQFLKQ